MLNWTTAYYKSLQCIYKVRGGHVLGLFEMNCTGGHACEYASGTLYLASVLFDQEGSKVISSVVEGSLKHLKSCRW